MPGIVRDSLRVIAADLGFRTGVLSSRSRPGRWLRGHILFLDLGWFRFTRSGVLQESIISGHPILRIRPPAPPPAPELEAWPRWDATHNGVRLWDICRYELCMKYDCSVDALERRVARSPRPDKAASETIQAAKWLIDWAAAAIDFYQPRVVMFQQGYVLPAAAMRAVARARELPLVALENTFRKDRICWDDTSGVTLASPIPMRIFSATRNRSDDDYFRRYREAARTLKSREHATAGATEIPRFDGRKILFIGQVNTDSSVLFHIGRGFPDQMTAANTVADHTVRTEGSFLLLKVHPKEVVGRNPLQEPYSLDRYAQFRRRDGVANCGRIHVDDEARIDIMTAIEWADLCVTINSQAGLEAAAMGKPVILCGEANYDHLRSVRRVETPEALAAALADHALPVDAAEARNFFHVYCEKYCKPARIDALIDLAGRGRPPRGMAWIALWVLLWPPTLLLKARSAIFDRR